MHISFLLSREKLNMAVKQQIGNTNAGAAQEKQSKVALDPL